MTPEEKEKYEVEARHGQARLGGKLGAYLAMMALAQHEAEVSQESRNLRKQLK